MFVVNFHNNANFFFTAEGSTSQPTSKFTADHVKSCINYFSDKNNAN